jgi:hypothetical protein
MGNGTIKTRKKKTNQYRIRASLPASIVKSPVIPTKRARSPRKGIGSGIAVRRITIASESRADPRKTPARISI